MFTGGTIWILTHGQIVGFLFLTHHIRTQVRPSGQIVLFCRGGAGDKQDSIFGYFGGVRVFRPLCEFMLTQSVIREYL